MRLILSSLLCFILVHVKAQHDNIIWNENSRLTYDDFRGPVPGDKLDHKAITFSVIEIKFDQSAETVNVNVLSYFQKDLSWMRNDWKNDYTLRHEQGHFDITEIHARKARKRLDGMKISRRTGKKKINKICQKLVKQHHKAQEKYDNATSYSIREKNQKEWSAKIAKELKKLDAYKNSTVVLKLK